MTITTLDIISWTTAVITAALSIPQLFKVLKERKTGDVNFTSFWLFELGCLLWVIFSVFSTSDKGKTGEDLHFQLLNSVIANGIGVIVTAVTIYLMYHFKKTASQKSKMFALVGAISFIVVDIALLALYTNTNFRLSGKYLTVMGLIFPALTTFAFFPQVLYSIKTKDYKGISLGMFTLYTINNILWMTFWSLSMKDQGTQLHLVGGLVWQIISFLIYSYQLGAGIYYLHIKKA
ncbi:PQ-loop domain-containing transporter [Mycoplasma sp. Ms02]|uniref:PQ-loop domain-containing transporter n=1 Tax=Mycoplasma sp. Ms02 TaxID=353851 RepID=UPI001C8A7569|nr:PQ-loop domain-containing transporter [Mycoplasma sp. Ms02]QZE12059.1 hypothetical protein K4L35_01725 [Mycoplasma sp. Ms02]